MTDLCGTNVRVKSFANDELNLANDFLMEYDGCIIDVQFVNGDMIVAYEDVNRYFLLYCVNKERKLVLNFPTSGKTIGHAIDKLYNFIEGAEEGKYAMAGKEITREQYKTMKCSLDMCDKI